MIGKTPRPTGREEDYRDYEERDLDEGWPYADAVPGSDDAGNPGFQRSSDTAIQSKNGPNLSGDDTEANVEDDVLEDTITNALEDSDIETSGVDIKARRGLVWLTGAVDTAQERRKIEVLIYAIPGVVNLRNDLTTSGADGGIPTDWDD